MRGRKYIMEDIEKLNEFIKTVEYYRVVKNCDEWDWEKRYPDFETAVNALLKQLDLQRELLLISIIWQKRNLLKKKTPTHRNN
jgi:hypothetical protein